MTPAMTDDLELAASLVRDAGRLAQRMRASGVRTDTKSSPADLVTDADRAAEQLVVNRLWEQRPDDGVLGEEGTTTAGTSGRTWVIDPVDGTFNFVAGLTWWCSAIALRDDDGIRLGAVHHAHDDVTWFGGPLLGTARNGEVLPSIADKPLADCSLTTYLDPRYFGRPELTGPFGALAGGAKTLRMLGSGSMDLAAVSEGILDLWCHHSVPPWDWLPGQALAEGVGARTVQFEAHGVTWSLAGPPTAVDEAVELLTA